MFCTLKLEKYFLGIKFCTSFNAYTTPPLPPPPPLKKNNNNFLNSHLKRTVSHPTDFDNNDLWVRGCNGLFSQKRWITMCCISQVMIMVGCHGYYLDFSLLHWFKRLKFLFVLETKTLSGERNVWYWIATCKRFLISFWEKLLPFFSRREKTCLDLIIFYLTLVDCTYLSNP